MSDKKVFRTSDERHVSSNGFVNYGFSTQADVDRAMQQVFIEYPNSVIINGSEDWSSPEYKRPEVFSRKLNVEVLALFHSGISGVTHSGIVISRDDYEVLAVLYEAAYGFPLSQHLSILQ
jgi:hypothetical protein